MLVNGSSTSYAVAWWSPHQSPAPAGDAAHRGAEGKTAFAAVVGFTFILLLQPQYWFPVLGPLRIAFLAAGFAIVSLLWDRWRHRRGLGMTWEMLVCFALPAWAFLTLPLSYWPGGSVGTLTDPYIKSVIVFWLLPNVVTTRGRLWFLATILVMCTLPLAFTGVKHFATGSFIDDSSVAPRIAGYKSGLSANPNDLALMLNLLLPLGIALFLSAGKTSFRVFCLIVLVIDAVAIILTFSRAGFLGLLTIGLLYFAKLVRRSGPDRGWAFAMLVLAIFALPFLPTKYVNRVATVANVESDPTGSSQIRWRDMVAAASFVTQHPMVGAGIGMDYLALNEVRGPRWFRVHNVYLQYAVDLGLPGLVLFLMLFYGVFRATLSSQERLADLPAFRDLSLLAEAVKVSLIVFFVSGFFYPVAYHVYFYYMGGLALATRAATNHAMNITKANSNADRALQAVNVGTTGHRVLNRPIGVGRAPFCP